MGNLVFLIIFYLNHSPIEHTLSSVNVCSCMTRLVCFRNLNVFYLVLKIPYLYMMHYDQSHSHCPLTSPSHSWWLPTFVSFFVLFLLHTWQQQSFHMQKEGFHTIFLVSLHLTGFSTTLLWCFSETKEWYRCLTQIWAHYHLFQDFG